MKHKITSLVLLLMLFAAGTSYAQIKTEFKPRHKETIHGDITFIANNVLSRDATADYNGEDDNHYFEDNVYVDIDNNAATFNSSNATLINPAPNYSCVSINKVLLYWVASDQEYELDDNGVVVVGNGEAEVEWNFDEVLVQLPTQTEYTKLKADEVVYHGRAEHFGNDTYVCVKDITTQVKDINNPFGTYQIANIKAVEGQVVDHNGSISGTAGGWQMVVIYESPKMPQKHISIFDGYAQVSASQNNFDITFDGFQTVPNGKIEPNLIIGGLEGDRNILQDQLLIKDASNNWVPVTTDLRPANNFFNSTITKDGVNFIDRMPASTNTLGFDASIFKLSNTGNTVIANNQMSAEVRLTSNQELYGMYLLGLAVEVWEPSLNQLELNTVSADNPTPGENVQFSLKVKNTGNDNIRDLTFTTPIPDEATFLEVNDLPAEISYELNATTQELIFTVADGFTDVISPEYTITYTVKVKDADYFKNLNVCSSSLSSQVSALYTGEINPAIKTSDSSASFDACGIGSTDPAIIPINIIDDTLPEFVAPLPEDMTVPCNGVPEPANVLATDNCEVPTVTFTETATNNRDCTTGYVITRTWTAIDGAGNTITHVQKITIVGSCDINDLEISKTITANGDGINDLFLISGLECNYIYEIQIFNRWGNIVYESNDYKNDWGGNAPSSALGSSAKVPSGTYYYIINFSDAEVKPVNGYIYIGSN